MGQPVTTRFGPRGANNSTEKELFGYMGQFDPTKFTTFFEDFVFSSDMTAAAPLNWTVTKVGTGTLGVGSEDGGSVLLTNSAADNDAISAQIKNPSFVLNAGKRSWFGARFKISDITQSDFLIGLTGLDTTPIGGAGTEDAGVAEGVFFLKIDGDTQLRFIARKGSATVASKLSGIAVPVAATYMSLGWEYNGVDEFRIFTNDIAQASGSDRRFIQVATVAAPFASGIPSLVIGPNLSIQNGEAVAKTASIDWIFAAQER